MHAHASSSGGADASSATHVRVEDDPQQDPAAAAAAVAVGEAQRLTAALSLDPPATPPPDTLSTLPVPLLHRHALESIFAFLDLGGLAVALRVCRDWQAAVHSMRALHFSVKQPTVPLCVVAHSSMGRHVSSLGGHGRAELDATALRSLCLHMAHLRDLVCILQQAPLPPSLPLPSPPQAPWAFPAALRCIDLELAESATTADINGAIAAVGRLALLEELRLQLPVLDPQLSFAPLAAPPQLRRLTVWWTKNREGFSDAQVDELRALPLLHQFSVRRLSVGVLRRLLCPPHALQWQDLCHSLPVPLNDEAAALLAQLPSLTTLECHPSCRRFEWLRGLPNLRAVSFSFYPAGADADAPAAAALCDGLPQCARLEKLTLAGHASLTAAHLDVLLPRLSQLRDLTLWDLSIDSLRFLSQTPRLAAQLRRLEVFLCTRLPPAELRHIHSLGALRQLVLRRSFSAPLDAHTQAQFRPPSPLLPRLADFEFEPTEAQWDAEAADAQQEAPPTASGDAALLVE